MNTNPLDTLIYNGGMASIFHRIGCIGDSLTSGEVEYKMDDAQKGFWDYYEYSWGKAMERASGIHTTIFSRGGLTAKQFFTEALNKTSPYDDINHVFEYDYLQQAYILALGVNDIKGPNYAKEIYTKGLGNVTTDVKTSYMENEDSIIGWYAKIIQHLQSLQPDAKFFLTCIPDDCIRTGVEVFNEQLAKLSKTLPNCYLIDLYTYGPKYDEEFRKQYFDGHMNCLGYQLTAYEMLTYLDWYVRNYPDEFKYVHFIGTGKKPYQN